MARKGLNLWLTGCPILQPVWSIWAEKNPLKGCILLLVSNNQTTQATCSTDLSTMIPNLIPGAERGGTHWNWELVAWGQYSRLGCVHGLGWMSDVLCGVEDSEGQATQEIPRGKQSSHRSEAEASACWEATEKENSQPTPAEPEAWRPLGRQAVRPATQEHGYWCQGRLASNLHTNTF